MTTPSGHEGRFRARESVPIFVVTLLLLVAGAPPLAPLGLPGVVIAQVALIAGPALLAAILLRRPLGSAFGLSLPTARQTAGAVLIGATLWIFLAVTIAPFADELAREGELEELRRQLTADVYPLWLRLAAFALTPAICEELLFRGALARSLAPRLGHASAILLSSVLFGVFHLSLARLVPTTLLGVALAYATLKTGSLLPAIVIHFLNNAIVLLLAELADPAATPEEFALSPAILVAAGLALAATLVGCRFLARPGKGPS